MNKNLTLMILAFCVCSVPIAGSASAEDALQQSTTGHNSRVSESGSGADEKGAAQNEHDEKNPLQSALAGLSLTGGISAGCFYTSNAGQGTSDNKWMLSNLVVEISSQDTTAPIGFAAAFGETSTPSILGSPEGTNPIEIEYASLRLDPVPGVSVKVGLLQPNAGYESSYTYTNKNAFLGALASQQPYNAYGAQIGYDLKDMHFVGGYYQDRLVRDEYVTDQDTPNESWECGVSGTLLDTSVSLYHYRLESLKSLTGAVIERTVGAVDFGFNMDYWHWEGGMIRTHQDDSSIGGAFYVVPHFGKFSLPVRLEYIDQGKSGMYLDSINAHQIYAVTLSPTYRFHDNAYVRADLGYVHADDGFSDKDANLKNGRIILAAEIGYTF